MSKLDSTRPAAVGYRWPAEWETHKATWLSWPHNRDTWPKKFEPMVPQYVEMVRALATSEPVHILAGGESARREAEEQLASIDIVAARNITFHDIPTNDAWIRDHGPVFLQATGDAEAGLIDWLYNSWGGKYPPYDLDNAVPRKLADLLSMKRFNPGFVLEGGAIEGNGNGTIMSTKSSLLDRRRNPTMDESIVARYLQNYLGMQQLIWLPGTELAGDDTDGHIDQLARFVNQNTIVYASCHDSSDENYASLYANQQALSEAVDPNGNSWQIIPLPIPAPMYYEGSRLPASYCNFYIANSIVLVPAFDDPHDEIARTTLQQCFPDRDVVLANARDIVWGLGAFHCLTQQQCMPHQTPHN
ncbi:MAG: agmatine deiminase [Pirellulaceae bacterium]|jgi:agmatine deiminase